MIFTIPKFGSINTRDVRFVSELRTIKHANGHKSGVEDLQTDVTDFTIEVVGREKPISVISHWQRFNVETPALIKDSPHLEALKPWLYWVSGHYSPEEVTSMHARLLAGWGQP